MFSLYSRPTRLNNEYTNVITVNALPAGPFQDYVKQIKFAPLTDYYMSGSCRCGYVVALSDCNCACRNHKYATPDDLTDVFELLLTNGYIVNTDITRMMFESGVKMGGTDAQKLLAIAQWRE
jgi:hypothetical protein